MQYRLRRNDGEYRWISDQGVARYDAQGRFAGYIGSCVDVTELMNKEEALRRSRGTSRSRGRRGSSRNLGMDPGTKELWMSDERAHVCFNWIAGSASTYAAFQCRVHPDDRALRDSAIKRRIRNRQRITNWSIALLLPDGTLRWIGGARSCVAGDDRKGARAIGESAST